MLYSNNIINNDNIEIKHYRQKVFGLRPII